MCVFRKQCCTWMAWPFSMSNGTRCYHSVTTLEDDCVMVRMLHYTAWWQWGGNDLRKCSFLHRRCLSLVLKELPRASTVGCTGWEELPLMDVCLTNILLTANSLLESRLQLRTEAALWTSFSLILSVCVASPQHTLAENTAETTTMP